jgi:FMN reductase
MLKIAVVVGNPKSGSRTAQIAQSFAKAVAPADATIQTIELSNSLDELFRFPSTVLDEAGRTVAASDIAIFASPTYKATYTGLLKAFLDRYSSGGLRDVVAVPLMTGSGRGHSLAPTTSLVPLLLELGAIVPVGGLFFDTGEPDAIDKAIEAHALAFHRALCKLGGIAGEIGDAEAD